MGKNALLMEVLRNETQIDFYAYGTLKIDKKRNPYLKCYLLDVKIKKYLSNKYNNKIKFLVSKSQYSPKKSSILMFVD